MKAAPLLLVLMTGCDQAPNLPVANKVAESIPATAPPAPPAAKAFKFDEENDLFEFHYGWSAEAAAVPQLVARFRTAMEKEKAELS